MLKANRLVPPDKLDFYLNWVDKFMKEQKYCKEKIGQDSLASIRGRTPTIDFEGKYGDRIYTPFRTSFWASRNLLSAAAD